MIKIFNHAILSREEYNRLIHDIRFSKILIAIKNNTIAKQDRRLRTLDTLTYIYDYLIFNGNDIRFEELILNIAHQIEDDFSLVTDFLC